MSSSATTSTTTKDIAEAGNTKIVRRMREGRGSAAAESSSPAVDSSPGNKFVSPTRRSGTYDFHAPLALEGITLTPEKLAALERQQQRQQQQSEVARRLFEALIRDDTSLVIGTTTPERPANHRSAAIISPTIQHSNPSSIQSEHTNNTIRRTPEPVLLSELVSLPSQTQPRRYQPLQITQTGILQRPTSSPLTSKSSKAELPSTQQTSISIAVTPVIQKPAQIPKQSQIAKKKKQVTVKDVAQTVQPEHEFRPEDMLACDDDDSESASTPAGASSSTDSDDGKKGKTKGRKSCTRWSADENDKLIEAIDLLGAKNWNEISKHVGTKNGDQCNQHWHRVLNPKISKNPWTKEEDNTLRSKVEEFGQSSWKKIAEYLPGRTDIQCRHRFLMLQRHKERGVLPPESKPRRPHLTAHTTASLAAQEAELAAAAAAAAASASTVATIPEEVVVAAPKPKKASAKRKRSASNASCASTSSTADDGAAEPAVTTKKRRKSSAKASDAPSLPSEVASAALREEISSARNVMIIGADSDSTNLQDSIPSALSTTSSSSLSSSPFEFDMFIMNGHSMPSVPSPIGARSAVCTSSRTQLILGNVDDMSPLLGESSASDFDTKDDLLHFSFSEMPTSSTMSPTNATNSMDCYSSDSAVTGISESSLFESGVTSASIGHDHGHNSPNSMAMMEALSGDTCFGSVMHHHQEEHASLFDGLQPQQNLFSTLD